MYIPEWCPGQRGECTWSFLHDQSLSLASPSVAPSCRNGPQEWLEQSLVSVQHPPHPIHSRGNSTAPYISIPTPFSTSHYAEVSKRRKLVCQEYFANEVHFGVRHPHTGLSVKIPVVWWLTYNLDPSVYSSRSPGRPEATVTS